MTSYVAFHEKDRYFEFNIDKENVYAVRFLPRFFLHKEIRTSIRRPDNDQEESKFIYQVIFKEISKKDLIFSSFQVFLYSDQASNIKPFPSATKINLTNINSYYDVTFEFFSNSPNTTFYGIFITPLPYLTQGQYFSRNLISKRYFIPEHYQTVNFKTNYTIELKTEGGNYFAVFLTNDEPHGQQIFVVKVSNNDSIIYLYSESPNHILLGKSLDRKFVSCGVIDCIYPFLNQENQLFNILPLPFDKFEYMPIKNVYQMTDFSVRFGYDQLSASIVFEFILREENQSKYESIGVELSSKFGRCFKYGFGLITDTKPLIVRFTPIDLQRIGRFDRDISIGFSRYPSTDLVKIPSSYLQPYQSNSSMKFAFSFLRLFFKLFIIHPEYFPKEIRLFIIQFAQNPTEFTILDFSTMFCKYNICGSNTLNFPFLRDHILKCLFTESYQEFRFDDFITVAGTTESKLVLAKTVLNGSIDPVKLSNPEYEIYLIQYDKQDTFALYSESLKTKDNIISVLIIRKEETPNKIPFIEFYKKSKENDKLLYHLTRPLMPLSTYPEILSFKKTQFGFTNSKEKIIVDPQNPTVQIPHEKNENTSKDHMSVFSYCQLEDSIVQDMSQDFKTQTNNSNDDLIPEIKFVAPKREEEASNMPLLLHDSKNETENKEMYEEEEDVKNEEEEEEEDVENEEEEEAENVDND